MRRRLCPDSRLHFVEFHRECVTYQMATLNPHSVRPSVRSTVVYRFENKIELCTGTHCHLTSSVSHTQKYEKFRSFCACRFLLVSSHFYWNYFSVYVIRMGKLRMTATQYIPTRLATQPHRSLYMHRYFPEVSEQTQYTIAIVIHHLLSTKLIFSTRNSIAKTQIFEL